MLSRFSQLLMNLHRGCREQPVAEYQDWAFDQVRSVFHFDSALWLTGTLDRNCQATLHTIHAHRLSPQVVADWARVSESRAVLTERAFRSPGVTFNCVVAKEFGPELLAHSRRYRIEHILATTSIDSISRLNELISVYRADPDNPFSEEERLVQQCIVPHLAETWRINRAHHMHLAQRSSQNSVACCAVTDRNGILHLIDPEFTALLLDEWPDWQGPALPDGLFQAIRNNGDFSGKHMVAHSSAVGDVLMLQGRRRSLLDSLTKREREVADCFASGLTYKCIAGALGLSPATVRNHLNNIYSKLGVGNKAELVAMLIGDRKRTPQGDKLGARGVN